jgi:hypothetical protein
MRQRTAARLAWSLWALAILFLALGLYLGATDSGIPSSATPARNDIGPIFLAAELAIITVGALVAARRPANPIGWLLCATGLVMSLGDLADGYAAHGLLAHPGSLPGAALMAWLSEWTRGPTILGALALVFLLFPDGRPLSRRWDPIVWLAAVVTPLPGLVALRPGPLSDYPFVTNPLGVGGAAGQVIDGVANIAFIALLALLAASGVSLVLRFYRAKGDERQQLKWFASGGAVVVIAFLIAPLIWFTPSLNNSPLWPILFALSLVALPLSMGTAILKYRLYDIDLIIRRTLVYSVLSALLVLVYFGSVVVLQSIVRGLTGQIESQFAIVVSTLGIAALFTPLRRRLQGVIDKRFYRRKYDAARTVAEFGANLRDEVELEALTQHLLAAVDETVQPESADLWLVKRE